jgi:hypothetical protein
VKHDVNGQQFDCILENTTRELHKFVRDPPSSATGIPELLFGIRRTSRLTKTTTPDEFLKQAHKVSLAVTLFEEKKITTICGTSTESCCRILPVSTLEKFGADKDKTVLGRAEALTGLVSHHSGEIVEVDAARSC